ncbi:MAG TPA: alpha/beta hydrolase [Mycobacterium sp.]|uniref:alpha/beta hydrolase n=1 Tax=Mycolicibacterium sp. TaxID=2320850 RepID=UPI0025CF217F|nr:alpha/beta hydrolase [Mycolicibacterium sp.]HPX36065.1 alpha/beta hydrolase [Mycobacterium sp.]HQC75868.1 alpha/beta hydrolase [Mycobacterium sp.]
MSILASRRHRKLAALPGVRSIRRPLTPGSAEQFDLHYVRTGPAGGTPLLIIPGGPGMGSIAAYQGLRRRAAEMGLDVIMVEHRGVGLSRRDDSGADLPPEALTIAQVVDDAAAVLDDAGVDTAAVYGASYGTYLAAGVGVRHPHRVSTMVLDSPLLNRNDFDVVRSEARALLWHDDSALAAKMRALTEADALVPEDLTIAAAVYGYSGPDLLERHLDLLLDGRRTLWAGLRWITLNVARRKVQYHNEFDLVGQIGFRELNFAGTPDGRPLDTTLTWRGVPASQTPFEAEPFDLVAEMPGFGWPTVVVSGGRDLITPAAVADRITELLPDPTRVLLPTAAHSMLDTRQDVALRIIAEVAGGSHEKLAQQAEELDALPVGTSVRMVGTALAGAARLAAVLPRNARPVTS